MGTQRFRRTLSTKCAPRRLQRWYNLATSQLILRTVPHMFEEIGHYQLSMSRPHTMPRVRCPVVISFQPLEQFSPVDSAFVLYHHAVWVYVFAVHPVMLRHLVVRRRRFDDEFLAVEYLARLVTQQLACTQKWWLNMRTIFNGNSALRYTQIEYLAANFRWDSEEGSALHDEESRR